LKDLPIGSQAARSTRTYSPAELGALLAVVLLAWFSVPTFVSLHTVWLTDFTYSHGYLVLAMTVYLVTLEVRREPLAPRAPSWLGLGALVAIAFVSAAAHAASTVAIAHLAFPLFWIVGVWTFAGAKNAQRFALPLGFLYFAMPVWHAGTEPLRVMAIATVSTGIRLVDVPAFIEGNFIHLPSGTIEVADGCAGVRYAIVAATLGAFLGLLHHGRWRPTLVLTLCAFALAVVGNWVRIFALVLVGHYSQMQNYLIVVDHEAFGWVVFAVFMAPLLWANRLLPPAQTSSALRSVPAGVSPSDAGARAGRAVVYLGCVALALGIWLNYRIGAPAASVTGVDLIAPQIPGWSQSVELENARRPEFLGATAQFSRWYEDGAERVGAYVAHYARQGQGSEVVFSHHRPQGKGTVVSRRSITVPAASGAALVFDELEVADGDAGRRLVWVGLRVAGRTVSGATSAKLAQIVGAIRGRSDAQALVLTVVCAADCSSARSSLSRYAPVATPRLYAQADGSWEEAGHSKATP